MNYYGQDTNQHGARLDVYIEEEDGVATGRATLAKTIQDFLSDLGTIPEKISKQIDSETDLDTLRRWLKLAAKSKSIEEFIEKI